MGFSIIICTYNPKIEILQLLLNAILLFNENSPEYEVIIVDNNSSPALHQNKSVADFISKKGDVKFFIETSQGLTSARIAGIQRAKFDWLVFFDDDNEPESDYLIKANYSIEKYSKVGMWGPGNVDVIYTEGGNDWINTIKELFQQRSESQTLFGKEKHFQPYYPFGTGLIIKKEVATAYIDKVKNGVYTLSDRKGKSLSSGGDVQMVLTGISIGCEAGIIGGLSLNHLIDASKANLAYLQKQCYGTATAYIKAYNQVFTNNRINSKPVSNFFILKQLYSLYRIHSAKMSKNDFKLLTATRMGEINAIFFDMEKPRPFVLNIYEKLINA